MKMIESDFGYILTAKKIQESIFTTIIHTGTTLDPPEGYMYLVIPRRLPNLMPKRTLMIVSKKTEIIIWFDDLPSYNKTEVGAQVADVILMPITKI